MFILDLKKTACICAFAASLFISPNAYAKELPRNVDGSIIYPKVNGKYQNYYINTQNIKNFNKGRTPSKNEIKAWNKDVKPDGEGLPEGSGSVEEGDELYTNLCASCHGDFGAGGSGYPTLTGGQGSLKNQLLKEGDEPPSRTIGSYWPYASTLYWYIQSAMPFNNPKSLSNDEVYALVAYLLSVNDIEIEGIELEDEYILNRKKFLKIVMPNVNGFYAVDPSRNDLKEMRPPLAQGNRCMKDCDVPKPVHIINKMEDFDPAISTVKDLPKTKKTVSNAEVLYKESCSSCHSNDAIGAPVLGDRDIWEEVKSKGVKKVYFNAINGINAMPARGGNMDLSDTDMKIIIDYMMNIN